MTENDSKMTLFQRSRGDILWVVGQSNKKTKQPVKQLAIAGLGKKKEGNKMADDTKNT